MLVLNINKSWGTFDICDMDDNGNGTILARGTMGSGNSPTDSEKSKFIEATKDIASIKVKGI